MRLGIPIRLRYVLLFLGAIVLPCAVLAGLGIRSMDQELELRRRRSVEDRWRAVDLARQELFARLQAIRIRALAGQVSPRDPEVAL